MKGLGCIAKAMLVFVIVVMVAVFVGWIIQGVFYFFKYTIGF